MYVITTDHDVKDKLEVRLSKLEMDSLQFMVTVKDELSISELSGPGAHLHGAKLVFVNENVDAFIADESYATTGSLMLANNNNLMIAVTCRHAVENKNNFYTLIGNTVLNLGGELPQPNNRMEKLHDDIAVIVINGNTRSEIDQKCEKRLINFSGYPSAGRMSLGELEIGDIVHKRGARTRLTTGIVVNIVDGSVKRFKLNSKQIHVIGRETKPFARLGDSGSLVFQQSLSPHKRELDVLAMVYGKYEIFSANPPVICFPFKYSCDVLETRTPGIENLQFF